MRQGLDAPRLELLEEKVAEIRVRHEQQGVDGPIGDHHAVLGVGDEDWATGDLRALDARIRLPALGMTEPFEPIRMRSSSSPLCSPAAPPFGATVPR